MDKIKVMIDPGHYSGHNTGIIAAYKEGDHMFTLGGYLKDALIALGIDAMLTKSTAAKDLSLTVRGKLAITNKCDVFISLHSDAGPTEKACGVSVFRSVQKPDSVKLATMLGNAISSYMKSINGVTYYRGTAVRESTKYPGNDYYSVIGAAATGKTVPYVFIIEHGFHSNKKECAVLNDEKQLKKIAGVEAKAIYDYFVSTGQIVIAKPIGVKKATTKTLVQGDVYKVVTALHAYSTAADAIVGTKKTASLKAGTYYIYKVSGGAYNITSVKGGKAAGSWINPAKNK